MSGRRKERRSSEVMEILYGGLVSRWSWATLLLLLLL